MRGTEKSPSRGGIRLTILLVTVGALLLVPATQAFATVTVTVNLAGTGKGEVTSVGAHNGWEGTPPLECTYESPGPAEGTCETELTVEGVEEFLGFFPKPAAGSEVAELVQEAPVIQQGLARGKGLTTCKGLPPAEWTGTQECFFFSEEEFPAHWEFTVVFDKAAPKGPTNRAALTITKSAGGTGGTGSVSSKPKGINCAAACNSAAASMYKNTPVTLKEKPSTGSTFTEWTGACSGSGETCTVPMAEAESVGAVFGGTSKAIANPQPLTLSKGESTGQGTVKAAGLACEADCSSTTVLYQGPTGVAPKNKPGKTVELKATAAYGSSFTGWEGSGCSGTAPCLVTMEEAKEVTATFTAKPATTLTVEKGGTGTGSVSSKPKAVNCGTACTTQDATVPEEAEVILKEKPGTGMTFTGWSGGGCSGTAETCTVSLTEAATVTASFSGSPKEIPNAKALTLAKAGSGYGTVKAAGLTCEALCASTVSLYQGPTGIAPKNKPGKTVVLKALSAPGSKQVEWTGCLSNPTPTECSVTMEEAKEVTATFNEIE